ncbi:uncharacterized protein LOC119172564 isoform X2 [Rhipicephalus microplus]|uniref:uncharacterized protein LOC119172564 isoform X2 n=1 Tax=Rhipicephalus microplus TaxID=6941 RepID=UPI003F6BF945
MFADQSSMPNGQISATGLCGYAAYHYLPCISLGHYLHGSGHSFLHLQETSRPRRENMCRGTAQSEELSRSQESAAQGHTLLKANVSLAGHIRMQVFVKRAIKVTIINYCGCGKTKCA